MFVKGPKCHSKKQWVAMEALIFFIYEYYFPSNCNTYSL